MSELKRRHAGAPVAAAAAPAAAAGTARPRKPLSTSKYKDKHSGLSYNYEDRLSKMRVLKTAVLMVLLTITVAYFGYNLYLWGSNVVFDIYWHHVRGVRSREQADFIRQLWIGNFLDLFAIIVKLVVAYWIFRLINSRLLLTYDDTEELNKYN
ncbi:hypothetical protein PICMEDRAFT_71555 [Pichia membranifaciens NRRL Y-2026]|uniref:Uncharacterized protein n=1 Tax=Pichia membranifaciens NRRL Y-2026 TaxID=763406 RepID=A0A1E3NN05_9ASCO|nr:hypothetical protein PICMEDRAFT_71555 [Pichia membranifaciens NRRL Y-2026]ODQ47486.1 hypothetical protein PICMEDRAFT_71555 [Pichia membranifaciens NRRL Y-2026]